MLKLTGVMTIVGVMAAFGRLLDVSRSGFAVGCLFYIEALFMELLMLSPEIAKNAGCWPTAAMAQKGELVTASVYIAAGGIS